MPHHPPTPRSNGCDVSGETQVVPLAVPLDDLRVLLGPAVVRDESPAIRPRPVDVGDVVGIRELAGGDGLAGKAFALRVGGQRTHAAGHVGGRL